MRYAVVTACLAVAAAMALVQMPVPANVPPETTESASPEPDYISTPTAPRDWVGNVTPVYVTEGRSTYHGSAVWIKDGWLITCNHVPGRASRIAVKVGEKWIYGNVARLPGGNDRTKDGAIIRMPAGQFDGPELTVRAPKHFEHVTVYGCKTQCKMRGIVTGGSHVALNLDAEGVIQGDSGGIVLADTDGAVVGVISGYMGANRDLGTQSERRMVAITPGQVFAPSLNQDAPQAATPQQAKPSDYVCGPNGCYRVPRIK